MGDVLSRSQQKAARRAAALHLGVVAVVSRVVKANNSTGTSSSTVIVYDQIPCNIAPVTDSNPTVQQNQNTTSVLQQRGFAWFPLEWVDERVGGAAGSVVIQRGDIIEVDGQKWRASMDQDPAQVYETRRRVAVNKPHTQVTA